MTMTKTKLPRHKNNEKDFPTFVGNNLAKVMLERGISALDLESKTGVRSQTILNIARNTNTPTLRIAYLLAWALAVPISELFPFDPGRAYDYVVKKRLGGLSQN